MSRRGDDVGETSGTIDGIVANLAAGLSNGLAHHTTRLISGTSLLQRMNSGKRTKSGVHIKF